MSLARALTKRVKRSGTSMARFDSIRNQISGPIALVSTTNMLSYHAPNIEDAQREHDATQSFSSEPSTPTRNSIEIDSGASTPSEGSTDATSVDSSPSAEHRLHPTYFSKPFAPPYIRNAAPAESIPMLPARALSHSKVEHERLARKRSLQFSRPSSPQSAGDSLKSRSSIDVVRNTASSLPNNTSSPNPFSRELEQLNEVVEEFGAAARDAAEQEDLEVMKTRGLAKFTAEDYVQEIKPLWDTLWEDCRPGETLEVWI